MQIKAILRHLKKYRKIVNMMRVIKGFPKQNHMDDLNLQHTTTFNDMSTKICSLSFTKEQMFLKYSC